MLTANQVPAFQRYIYRFFAAHGRSDLPWRQDFDPYKVLVSEIMLQQTQVERVVPKFEAFLQRFPQVTDLAQASPGEVIKLWQGLGYNRRGLNLQRAAQKIVAEHGRRVPQSTEALLALPGIGPYATAAIQAFAFNQPGIVIETNIRAVYLFHFFHGAYSVDDQELRGVVEVSLDHQEPRQWYSALMDYGSYLKSITPNPSRRSRQYVKQSSFAGSHRQLRGEILRTLAQKDQADIRQLPTLLNRPPEKVAQAVSQLAKEGFLKQDGFQLSLVQ